MCSIIISIKADEAKELVCLNKYRGTHSFSLTVIDYSFRIISQEKSLGELDEEKIKLDDNQIVIIHQQAPTTSGKSTEYIHPDIMDNNYLWHNGIIKDSTCDKITPINTKLGNWDTHLVHSQLLKTNDLNNIDGSFALAILKENHYLKIARNEIAPLFWNNSSISSTKFDSSNKIPSNCVWKITPFEDKLYLFEDEEMKFTTVNNPYYFIE